MGKCMSHPPSTDPDTSHLLRISQVKDKGLQSTVLCIHNSAIIEPPWFRTVATTGSISMFNSTNKGLVLLGHVDTQSWSTLNPNN